MIIDAHQHAFWRHRDDRALVADMDAYGIDAAWLLTWNIAPGEDCPFYHGVLNPLNMRSDGTHGGITLSDQITARQHYRDRFILGYCPHPLLGDAPALFEAAYHMHGVRVCGEWKCRIPIDDPRCIELFRKAGELHCPVILHLDVPYLFDPDTQRHVYQPRWFGGTFENLRGALEACPDTIFIGHAAGFWREISGDADTHPDVYPREPIVPGGRIADFLETYKNLSVDLSASSGLYALQRDAQFARDFLCRFADRILFGRDAHGNELAEFLDSLDLPEDVRAKVFFENALGLAGLPQDHRSGQ